MKTPDRTAFIHIGGPKTGSASIQKALKSQNLATHHHIQVGPPNHSALLSLLFIEKEAKRAPFFRRRGWSSDQMDKQRTQWMQELRDDIESTDKHLILSSEMLCAPGFGDEALIALQSFLQDYVSDIRIIGYVRSPVSYLQSAFQQRLKGVRVDGIKMKPVFYRRRFEKFDRIFGAQNVQLGHYDRATLTGGDVVVDFASRIGADLVGYTRMEDNTSLSLQATAILYAQKKLGAPIKPHQDYDNDTGRMLTALRTLGGDKLLFGAALLDPVLEKCADDIDWMEKRLGVVIRDYPAKGAHVISSEQALLEIAEKTMDDLGGLVIREILGNTKGPEAVARLADTLRATVSKR